MQINLKDTFKWLVLLLGFLAVLGGVIVGVAFAAFSSPEIRAQMELDDLPEPGNLDKAIYRMDPREGSNPIANPAYGGIDCHIGGRGADDWLRVDFLTVNGQAFVTCNTMAEAFSLSGHGYNAATGVDADGVITYARGNVGDIVLIPRQGDANCAVGILLDEPPLLEQR